MSEFSKIQWTHATFNPWRGCARVSPGCEHCYAETWAKRNPAQLGVWGVDGTRVIASEAMWGEPLKWDRKAAAAGTRYRVFCASLADVAEDRLDLIAPRERLCDVIRSTPHLDWLLLTKRIENMTRLFPVDVLVRSWVGVTTEDQIRLDARVPILYATPAKIRFISAEPMLEGLDLAKHRPGANQLWVIIGGESGGQARPCAMGWVHSLVRQCQEADVSVFVKQLGSHPLAGTCGARLHMRHSKGGDMAEWPEDLRVRQFPEVPAHA